MTLDMMGFKCGQLTVIEEVDRYKEPNGKVSRMFLCKCTCGRTKIANGRHLRRGSPVSCGMCKIATISKSGRMKYGNTVYNIWSAMKHRCTNKSNKSYTRYGGRGITVCDEWMESLDAFVRDMGCPPPGLSLDRIDNDGHYCKENCRWVTPKQQRANQG